MSSQSTEIPGETEYKVHLVCPTRKQWLVGKIRRGEQAKCSSISRGFLDGIGWTGGFKYVDDQHRCLHDGALRIEIDVGYAPQFGLVDNWSITFCLLEVPETTAVLAADEHFWKAYEAAGGDVAFGLFPWTDSKEKKSEKARAKAEDAARARKEDEANDKRRQLDLDRRENLNNPGSQHVNSGSQGSGSGTAT